MCCPKLSCSGKEDVVMGSGLAGGNAEFHYWHTFLEKGKRPGEQMWENHLPKTVQPLQGEDLQKPLRRVQKETQEEAVQKG